MRSSRKGSRDRCTRRSGGRCSGEDAGKPMSAFRLLAAGLIVAAFASPARAAAPGICAEGAGAMAMHLYSVAVARLDACLALEELTPMQRATALKQRGDAHFAEEQTALALADYERALDLGGPDPDIPIARSAEHTSELQPPKRTP